MTILCSPCTTLTASDYVPQPGATVSTTAPCFVQRVVISAPVDNVVITLADCAALENGALPSSAKLLLDQVRVIQGTTQQFDIAARAYKGLYLKVVSGTTPRVTVYVA